jgi:AAA domain
MSSPAQLYFEELSTIHQEQLRIELKYPGLRTLLEAVSRELTDKEGAEFNGLFARLNYLCKKTGLPGRKCYQIHSLRVNANKVLHEGFHPSEDDYQYDVKALAETIAHFYQQSIPEDLQKLLPEKGRPQNKSRSRQARQKRTRIAVDHVTSDYIFGVEDEYPSEELIKIRYNVSGVNDQFNATISKLWSGALINILNFTIEPNGDYLPDYIVLEPDHLIDISAIAECYKEYGDHPLNFLLSKLNPMPNTHYLILGNIANTILDELVNERPDQPVQLKQVLRKAFRESPFNISSCEDLPVDFNKTCEEHFEAIRTLVKTAFVAEKIDPDRAILEPSFICEPLGIQGRLDLMLDDHSRIVELKSGKAETFKVPFDHKENHYVQVLLYYAVLEFNIGYLRDRRAYLLYSKHGKLHSSSNLESLTKSAINKRNIIVANERTVAFGNSEERMALIAQLQHHTLITKILHDNFLNRYVLPDLNAFYAPFSSATAIMISYFDEFLGFIAREHYLAKSGENSYERRGLSALWLVPLRDKIESGDIFIDLSLIAPVDPTAEVQRLFFKVPNMGADFMPNFRKGDIVMIYKRNTSEDGIMSQQVFKGTLEDITQDQIIVRLRYRQRNVSVLPQASLYALEHDHMDVSYQSMYRGLYCLLKIDQRRQQLLVGDRMPETDTSRLLIRQTLPTDLKRIVLKAKQAKDYFILVGPPGTGKTSQALKAMIEEFQSDEKCQLLLLAYTNRAVDEICETLEKVNVPADYTRIGSELSSDARFHHRLLDNRLANCQNREAVRECIERQRIFVGTITSLSGKMELFKLKSFDVAIIDEAAQILEPHLFPLLSATGRAGRPAITKFIMIGDHRQLPAIVLQSDEHCKVKDEALRKRGFLDKRVSLFERLYLRHCQDNASPFWDMLLRQGRMHPELAHFPNIEFYSNLLESLALPHQVGLLPYSKFDGNKPLQRALATHRLMFIPSKADIHKRNGKSNQHEAVIVREVLRNIVQLCELNNISLVKGEQATEDELSIGIIVPYRNQIALIRKELASLNAPELNNISIDTVERYQGSQRDLIIYSFCVNRHSQLSQLSNVIVENGQHIDRKLNVAITRARKQLIITGDPRILSNDLIYNKLIEHIKLKDGYNEEFFDNLN